MKKARKKRGGPLGSAPREHAYKAREFFRHGMRDAEAAAHAAERGSCKAAFSWFEYAARWNGKLESELSGIRRPWLTGGTRQPLLRRMNKARRAIKDHCLR